MLIMIQLIVSSISIPAHIFPLYILMTFLWKMQSLSLFVHIYYLVRFVMIFEQQAKL